MDVDLTDPVARAAAAREGLALEGEFNDIVRAHGGDLEGRETGDGYLATTKALYHGRPLSWALTPKVFSEAGVALIADAAETMGRIMDKVTRAFAEDAAVRRAFLLSPEVEGLCLLPTGYACPIPLARVDIFLNEETGDFWFCELNTDGSAGMTSAVEVTRAIQRTASYGEFAERHPNIRTFDILGACAEAILATYGEWEGRGTGALPQGHPSIGVVDYGESISMDEVEDFVGRFASMGVRCRFSEIRDLRVEDAPEGPRLVDGEGPIDLVWRRAVLSEMVEKPCPGAEALVRAQREGLACVVGGFRTWPCATKTVFAVLREPALRSRLTEAERAFVEAHVPYTEVLTRATDLSRFADKDSWIVKPRGGYNAVGVVAGLDVAPKSWEEVLLRAAEAGDVIQAYAPQFRVPTALGGVQPAGAELADMAPYAMMEGLFLFRGRFGGVFTRCGREATIGEWTERLNMGCLVVGEPTDGEAASRERVREVEEAERIVEDEG